MPGMKIRNCFNNSFDIFRWRHCLTVPLFFAGRGRVAVVVLLFRLLRRICGDFMRILPYNTVGYI